MNDIERYRLNKANRRCKFCTHLKHIGPALMPACIPDAYQCEVSEKLVKPNDRRPFCKYYKLNKEGH